MKKAFILFLSTLLLCFSCKGNTPAPGSQNEDVSLSELKIDGDSILEKMDQNLHYDAGDVEKYSIAITAKSKSATATIKIFTDYAEATGSAPDFTFNLCEGESTIKILCASSKNPQNKKEYTLKVKKVPSNASDEESSKIKELKVDGRDVLSKMDAYNVATLASLPKHIEKVSVYVLPHNSNAQIKISNGSEKVDERGGNVYDVFLSYGDNAIKVDIKSEKEGIKQHTINIRREEDVSLVSFMLEDIEYYDEGEEDIKNKSIVFSNDKTQVKLKVKAKLENTQINVKLQNASVQKEGDAYTLPLQEGENVVEVELKLSDIVKTYSCVLSRESNIIPSDNEILVEVNVSDSVNGSHVEGTYLNVYKTEDNVTLIKRTMVVHGKVRLALVKNTFYDFKLEGGISKVNDVHYAASDIISYYVDDAHNVIPMVQPILSYITRPSIAPKVTEFKFDKQVIKEGSETTIDKINNIYIKLETASTIEDNEDMSYAAPKPMLGVGFVPTKLEDRGNVLYATKSMAPKKNAKGTYDSKWNFFPKTKLPKDKTFDIVAVVYDIANNRVEYHARFKTGGNIEEKDDILISDLSMDFVRYSTGLSTFSVGQDEQTGNPTHYNAALYFRCKKGGMDVLCIGFDIYRKCTSDGENDFKVVKHFLYDVPKRSSADKPHAVYDNDGLLEDEKTYVYKLVAYIDDNKKGMLSKSPEVELTVPKSTSIILDYPCDISISQSKAKNLGYVFNLNPKVLKDAKEMKLGFIISNRFGKVYNASKFKYVFKDKDDKPELYFAVKGDVQGGYGYYFGTKYSKKRSDLTSKKVEELIKVDMDTGKVTITKDLLSINKINIASSPTKIPYNVGDTYYWDIVDWGVAETSPYDDAPVTIITEKKNCTIINMCNDSATGSNAWNGKAEFSVKK